MFAAGELRARTHNATKLNNAWWRWFKPGQRNPPVEICLHDVHQGSMTKADLGSLTGVPEKGPLLKIKRDH
jgi:hypothetical protein